jgi:hypothetical protein
MSHILFFVECVFFFFFLSFIGNMEHVVAQPLVVVHLYVVRKLIHAQIYSFESLIVFCM